MFLVAGFDSSYLHSNWSVLLSDTTSTLTAFCNRFYLYFNYRFLLESRWKINIIKIKTQSAVRGLRKNFIKETHQHIIISPSPFVRRFFFFVFALFFQEIKHRNGVGRGRAAQKCACSNNKFLFICDNVWFVKLN